jgi:hypothetical protein
MDYTPESVVKCVDSHVAQLMEHFDAVQIFVSRHDGETGNTGSIHRGGGNWYARVGQVQEWLSEADEDVRDNMRMHDGDCL